MTKITKITLQVIALAALITLNAVGMEIRQKTDLQDKKITKKTEFDKFAIGTILNRIGDNIDNLTEQTNSFLKQQEQELQEKEGKIIQEYDKMQKEYERFLVQKKEKLEAKLKEYGLKATDMCAEFPEITNLKGEIYCISKTLKNIPENKQNEIKTMQEEFRISAQEKLIDFTKKYNEEIYNTLFASKIYY